MSACVMGKTPLPIFTVEVTCSRLWGNEQQNHLDRLAVFSAAMTPEAGLKLLDQITDVLNETLPGALAPISQGAASTLDALGKNKQLALLADEGTKEQGNAKD